MANDPALMALAEMLKRKQLDIMRPGVTVGATPPPLPPFQPPGTFARSVMPEMPPASALPPFQPPGTFSNSVMPQVATPPLVPPQRAATMAPPPQATDPLSVVRQGELNAAPVSPSLGGTMAPLTQNDPNSVVRPGELAKPESVMDTIRRILAARQTGLGPQGAQGELVGPT